MDILKRAFLFSIRKKGKSLTLFFLFILITSFITISFSILSATQVAAAKLRETIGASFTLQGNVVNVDFNTDETNYTTQFIPISQKIIDTISGNTEIKGYNSRQSASVHASSFFFTSGMPYGTSIANTATEWDPDFINGTLTLIEGEHIAKENHAAALINQKLAEENDLSIGDYLLLSPAKEELSIEPVTIEIIGIYESDVSMEFNNDTIFTDHDTFWELTGNETNTYSGRTDFFVTDPARLAVVIEQIRKDKSIPWNNYILKENRTEYDTIAYQLWSMGRLIMVLIVSVVIVSTIILLLILVMRIKNRIHEVGVLLAVGVSKGQIILQFMAETVA